MTYTYMSRAHVHDRVKNQFAWARCMLVDSPFDWSKIEVGNTVTSVSSSHLTSSKFSERKKIKNFESLISRHEFSLFISKNLSLADFPFLDGKSEKFKFNLFF